MGGGMGNGNLEDVLERLPALTIADLKIGETIGVSKSSGTANRYTAFKIIAGVEPFLSVPTRTGGAGNQPTINIPGLDGGFGN
jgi:hypothetical protein